MVHNYDMSIAIILENLSLAAQENHTCNRVQCDSQQRLELKWAIWHNIDHPELMRNMSVLTVMRSLNKAGRYGIVSGS